MINLADEVGVVRDKGARSLSYYCINDVVGVDDNVVSQLIDVSANNGDCDARICLHKSPEANFHEMIILQHQGRYYRPHKHHNKGESCHIIRGKVCFFVFNDQGMVTESSVVGGNDCLIYRAGIDRWHTIIPITQYAVYHESKPGPYLSQGDSVYPDWAPDGTDTREALDYMNRLLAIAQGRG